jgi:hypothetical protein
MAPQNTSREAQEERVILYPWKPLLISTSVVSIIAGALLYYKFKSAIVVVVSFFLFFLVFGLNFRRRLTISKYEIAYRPPIGTTWRAKFADVTSIQKTSVPISYFSKAITKGLLFELSNATAVGIPLDLPNGAEIGDQIIKAWEDQRKA